MKKFSHVTKRFKNLDAVRDVTFTIKDKEIFGLWDPTSRGRLILTMATVFRAHGGEITVNGSSDSNQPERVKEQIGISF